MQPIAEILPWHQGWLITAPSGTPCRPAFRLGAQPGELAPNVAGVSWKIRLVAMQNAGCLSHGFILADSAAGKFHHVLSPAPATLCGEADGPAEIHLVSSKYQIRHDGNVSTICGDGFCVVMIFQHEAGRTRWALVWSPGNELETLVHAKAAIAISARMEWEKLLESRRQIWARASCDTSFRPAMIEAVEWLLGALRPPDGTLPGTWIATRADEPAMDLSRAIAILPALAQIAPADARKVLATIFLLEEPDHSLPAHIAPDLTPVQRFAPLPMLATATLALWRQDPSLEFARDVVPRLARMLLWQLDHFEAQAQAVCRWRHPSESLVPEIYDDGLATPDLSALLLFEIDALAELAAPFPDFAPLIDPFVARRTSIEKALLKFFWDAKEHEFRSRYLDGRAIARRSVAEVLPLLSVKLLPEQIADVLKSIAPGGPLHQPFGITNWVKWEADATAPTASPLVEILLRRALHRLDLEESTDAFERYLIAQIQAARQTLGRLPVEFSSTPTPGGTPYETAALVVHLAFGDDLDSIKMRHQVSPFFNWLDRQRNGIAIAVMITAIGAGLYLAWPLLLQRPAVASPETRFGSAQMSYGQGDYRAAIGLYEELRGTPLRDSQEVDFHLGNAWFHLGGWTQAETAYRIALTRNPDQPRAWMNLALSLARQRKFDDAEKIYRDFIGKYSKYYPDLAARAQTAIELCKQQRTK